MNEAVSLGQMIGWCQWAPLSQAAEGEAGPIGYSLLGGAFVHHSVSYYQL